MKTEHNNPIIMKAPLFKVEGGLVENYNRALEKLTGKKTMLNSFHIDKRGKSPELEEELGKDYLQAGHAHRFCIVLSPNQRKSGLINEEFSFDNELIDFLYENYLPVISLATRIDSLCGEIHDNLRHCETPEDLLLIKKVHLELHTPSGFLTKGRELQNLVRKLRKKPALLTNKESAVPKRILELVDEVGDVRNYNLSPVQATKELQTFYSRLLNGVFVFGDIDAKYTVTVKRPGQQSRDKQAPIPSWRKNKGSITVVIYDKDKYSPEDGPVVKFIPIQDKSMVINFLLKNRYAEFSYELLESRLSRMEDETLLSKGHDITGMGREQKAGALHKYHKEMLPEWYELNDLKRKVSKGHNFLYTLGVYSESVKAMLLAPVYNNKTDMYVAEYLLSIFDPRNYERMFRHNTCDLKKLYADADENRQKYIAQVIAELYKEQSRISDEENTDIDELVSCPACGHNISEKHKKCVYCGKSV
ncbi:MAG: hypothetical protein GY795_47755 [Desulfobacterales bacterium]|nr:hypothetical protein [Desulfobacterales bacterium]